MDLNEYVLAVLSIVAIVISLVSISHNFLSFKTQRYLAFYPLIQSFALQVLSVIRRAALMPSLAADQNWQAAADLSEEAGRLLDEAALLFPK